MKKFFNSRFLTIIALLTLVSCNKNLGPVGQAELASQNDISEAKAWFESTSKNARIDGSSKVYSEVYWKYAKETKMDKESKQAVVIVPISHGYAEKKIRFQAALDLQ